MPRLLARLAAVLLAVSAAACQTGRVTPAIPFNGPRPELRVAVAALPTITDPAMAAVYESGITRVTYEPLLRPKGATGVEGAAADRFSVSGDGLTYTFHLRPGARWADGAPVVARQFLDGWRRVLDPRLNSPAADTLAPLVRNGSGYFDLDPVKNAGDVPAFLDRLGLAAPDPATFTVTLAAPNVAFPWVVTMAQLAPVRLDAMGALLPIGNGPYKLAHAEPGEVDLVPAADYWGGAPGPSRLVLVPRGDPTGQLETYDKGRLGLFDLDPAAMGGHGAGSRRLEQVPQLTAVWFQFNVHAEPFDNPRLRLAVAQAVDRRQLVNRVLAGGAQPLYGLAPVGLAAHRPELGPQAFDSSRARATLDSSGVRPEQLGDLKLLVRDVPRERALAQAFADQVRANLGVQLNLDVQPSDKVSARLATGRFQLQGPGGWVGDYPDEQDFFDIFHSGSVAGQWSRYQNPAYDRLVDSARGNPDAGRRLQQYVEAQQLLAQEAPVVFLYQPVRQVLRQNWVGGFHPTGMDDWPGDVSAATLTASPH